MTNQRQDESARLIHHFFLLDLYNEVVPQTPVFTVYIWGCGKLGDSEQETSIYAIQHSLCSLKNSVIKQSHTLILMIYLAMMQYEGGSFSAKPTTTHI